MLGLEKKEIVYTDHINKNSDFFISVDIGGTNSNFGIFELNDQKPKLILSLHYKSQKVTDFSVLFQYAFQYLKEKYGILIKKGCIGAAGIVFPERKKVKPTNLNTEIDIEKIKQITNIEELILINDFEAVALGLEYVDPESIVLVNEGISCPKANIGFIGAGTGLGKCILSWQKGLNRYLPIASEGGHADVAIYHEDEYELLKFIHNNYDFCPVSWENVISGDGISRIYQFLGSKKNYPETEISKIIAQKDFNPDKISYYADKDERSKDTFDMYIRFYARCAKDFALETLALNGIYIAGGIASKNVSMFFDSLFLNEFQRCGAHSKKLKKIPINIISDYNISLYGGYGAFKLYKEGLL